MSFKKLLYGSFIILSLFSCVGSSDDGSGDDSSNNETTSPKSSNEKISKSFSIRLKSVLVEHQTGDESFYLNTTAISSGSLNFQE